MPDWHLKLYQISISSSGKEGSQNVRPSGGRNPGAIEYQEFYPKDSIAIIDEIDTVLAKHYGFTEEELDFIINYDIKYRMGLSAGSGEEEA